MLGYCDIGEPCRWQTLTALQSCPGLRGLIRQSVVRQSVTR